MVVCLGALDTRGHAPGLPALTTLAAHCPTSRRVGHDRPSVRRDVGEPAFLATDGRCYCASLSDTRTSTRSA
jgi:hypothetical protein